MARDAGTHSFVYASDDATATGDNTAVFVATEKVQIVEIGVRPTVLLDVGAGFVGKFDKEAGGTRGDGDVGALTKTADVAVGKCLRTFVDVVLAKGDVVYFEVTDAADTGGTIFPYIKYYTCGAGASEANDVDSE